MYLLNTYLFCKKKHLGTFILGTYHVKPYCNFCLWKMFVLLELNCEMIVIQETDTWPVKTAHYSARVALAYIAWRSAAGDAIAYAARSAPAARQRPPAPSSARAATDRRAPLDAGRCYINILLGTHRIRHGLLYRQNFILTSVCWNMEICQFWKHLR